MESSAKFGGPLEWRFEVMLPAGYKPISDRSGPLTRPENFEVPLESTKSAALRPRPVPVWGVQSSLLAALTCSRRAVSRGSSLVPTRAHIRLGACTSPPKPDRPSLAPGTLRRRYAGQQQRPTRPAAKVTTLERRHKLQTKDRR